MPVPQTQNLESGTWNCVRCGECCRWSGHVLLTDEDINRLAALLQMEESAFVERYTCLASNRRNLSLVMKEDDSCVFLRGAECEVYAARPVQCRTFPHQWSVSGGCAQCRDA